MSISTRTRFEVFKRDRFTCAYCGRTPPEALLHVDHIVPKAAGGSDDIENLITACDTCNLGKADRMLEEGTAPVVGRASVEEARERLDQAKAYAEVSAQLRELLEDQVWAVTEAWAKAFGATAETRDGVVGWRFHRYYDEWPSENSLRNILRRLPLDQVLEAVDITAGWTDRPTDQACRYFYGICWKRIRARDGQ